MNDFGASMREALSRLRREQANGKGVGTSHGPDATGATAGDASRAGAAWVTVEQRLPGREVETSAGRCYLHTRTHEDLEPSEGKRAQFRAVGARLDAFAAAGSPQDLIEAARLGLERSLVLDLETTGFSSTPIFLAGCLVPDGNDFLLLQYFARDYAEEKALIAAVAEPLARAEVLITFNGKSYDLPLLRDRAAMHGVALTEPPLHLDLLHHARRRYRTVLPDCRLSTLEWARFGRRRYQDVHGAEIPRLYHEFVRSGDFEPLLPVFHHNIFDLLTLSSLVGDLLLADPPPSARAKGPAAHRAAAEGS